MSSANEQLDALSKLAMDFRGASEEDRPPIVSAFHLVLNALLDSGWNNGLDPDSELPDELMPARYVELCGGAVTAHVRPLLREALRGHDALLMTVASLGSQEYAGHVHRIYSRRFEAGSRYDSHRLRFVGAGSAWGNQPLVDGERALVFISYLKNSDRYYQQIWQGHFSVEDIDGAPHAIANWQLATGPDAPWEPGYLRDAAFLVDESVRGRVALPFALLEMHLLEELALLS